MATKANPTSDFNRPQKDTVRVAPDRMTPPGSRAIVERPPMRRPYKLSGNTRDESVRVIPSPQSVA